MNIKIEKVKEYEQIYNLLIAFNESFKPPLNMICNDLTILATKMQNNAITLKCIQNETKEVLGYISFYANNQIEKQGFLSQIAVKKDCRGQNVGEKLVKECITISRYYGMRSIKLQVYKENQSVIYFYNKLGFSLEQEDEKSFYMVLNLLEVESV